MSEKSFAMVATVMAIEVIERSPALSKGMHDESRQFRPHGDF